MLKRVYERTSSIKRRKTNFKRIQMRFFARGCSTKFICAKWYTENYAEVCRLHFMTRL
jgi:hypothetical protein